jgi:hypothetical protein
MACDELRNADFSCLIKRHESLPVHGQQESDGNEICLIP